MFAARTVALLILSTGVRLALSGGVPVGGACSTNNSRVDSATHRFVTECDETSFCSDATNGTCQAKQCRRDEFPFGYTLQIMPLPPSCGDGTFCPDEGSGCQSMVDVGQPCQMNRDEQCKPPPEVDGLASSQNFNVARCLQTTCMYANATLGQRCILDQTTYLEFGPNGQQFSHAISRHNCQTPLLYCDPSALQCFRTKPVGIPCEADLECHSENCGAQGMCVPPAGTPNEVKSWQYAVTILVVVISMSVTVAMLVVIHKRLRLRHQREIRDYYHEQLSLRHSMFELQSRASNMKCIPEEKFRYMD